MEIHSVKKNMQKEVKINSFTFMPMCSEKTEKHVFKFQKGVFQVRKHRIKGS